MKHRKNRRKNEREGSSLPAWTKSKNNAMWLSCLILSHHPEY